MRIASAVPVVLFASFVGPLAPAPAAASGSERVLAGGPGPQEGVALAPDGAGGFYSAWVERPSTVKVQRLRADGTPGWPAALSLAGGDVTRLLVVGTRGGAFVAWGVVGGGNATRVQFVEPGGQARWGAPVTLANQQPLRAVSDGTSGVAILGRDTRGLYLLTVLDAGGKTMSRTDGIGGHFTDLSGGPTDTDPVDVAAVASGEFVVASGGATLHVRKVGRGAWGPVKVVEAFGNKSPVRLVADGAGGAVVVWGDRRRVPRETDVYARRVDANGRLLGADGGTELHRNVRPELGAASDGAGGAIAAFEAHVTNDLGHTFPRVHAQRVTGAGARAWTASVRLDAGTDSSRLPSIAADGAGGAFVVQKTEPTGTGARIVDCLVAQRVGPDGARLFGANGMRFGRCGSEPNGQVIAVGRDAVLVGWRDTRDGYPDAYLWLAPAPGAVPPPVPPGPPSTAGYAVAPMPMTKALPKSAEILPRAGKPATAPSK